MRLSLRKLEDALQRAARTLPLRGLVSLVVVDDPAMRRLNRRFCRRRGTTDVLAFSLGEGEGPTGEVIVSADTAKREARRRFVPIWRELLLYCLHGLLHLAGHDDQDAQSYARMHEAERALLARAGLDAATVKRLVPDSMLLWRG